MLALAATQEKDGARYTSTGLKEITANDTYSALEQYTKALKRLNFGISAHSISTKATLICCLLLTFCDLWHLARPQIIRTCLWRFRVVQNCKDDLAGKELSTEEN